MSAKINKRDSIRILDAREDLSRIFDGQCDSDADSPAESGQEQPFSRMLEDSLSGLDQHEIIRQKFPESVPESKKYRTPCAGSPQADLDLHGCHVHEALVRVEVFIETCALKGLDAVRIIVGKGLHSQGSAVLPDAVEGKIVDLKRRGRVATFAWEKKHKRSSGALFVYLK